MVGMCRYFAFLRVHHMVKVGARRYDNFVKTGSFMVLKVLPANIRLLDFSLLVGISLRLMNDWYYIIDVEKDGFVVAVSPWQMVII